MKSSYFKKINLTLFLAVFLLSILGLLSIYSSSFRHYDFSNFEKQIIFLALGIVLMFIISFFDYRIFKNNQSLILILYLSTLVLLIGVLFLAPQIRGAKSWYQIGDFNFQPSAFLKIVLIILFAKFFSMRHVELYRVSHILRSGFYLFLPCLLILLQPDLGYVIILFLVWLGVLLVSGIQLRHFFLLSFCLLIVLMFSWFFLFGEYQKQRIISMFFLHDPLGVSWSQIQSKIAIGSGGFWGKGLAQGSQVQLLFLPEPHNDFIFAAIAEEMGLVGVCFMFFLFFIILFQSIKIYLNSRSNFARLLVAGTLILWFSQIFVNIGMNLKILPVIGISLPFVSYGGSDLISNYVLLGILQSIKMND